MKKAVYLLILLALLLSGNLLHAYYFGQNKVNSTYTRWSLIETMHFDIYFPAGDDNFGKLAALMAEDTYYYLKNDFQFPAVSRIPIIFYSSQQEFQNTNIIYPLLSEGVGGFTESLRNRVAIPFDGSYSRLEQTLTHELTHAYLNALDRGSPGSFFYLRNFNFPFWFTEGLPEYEAVGGEDVSNNAYMLDMVINDRLQSLENASGYNAYRMGESFLVFLKQVYGRDKVMDYLYTLRAINDTDKATQKIFGMKFKELELRWRNQLKREYFPFIQTHAIPSEYSSRKTNHTEDGSYFNLAPRFSPDGLRYIYFSNRNGRFSIWSDDIFESSAGKKLITGEATGDMEEFHYLRTNLAWFPDNKRFAYITKTSFGDRLTIADYDKAEITEQIEFPGFKAIYEIDISPDGASCVFSGQKGMQSDIYIYEFRTHELTQLTNDKYNDSQPRYSPDGRTVAFTSERNRKEEDFRRGLFSGLYSSLYTFDLETSSLTQVTFDQFNCSYPVWDSTGTRLAFISERDSVPNLEILNLKTGERATLTKTLSGIYGFDLTRNGNYLAYSCFFDQGWDIYLKTDPLGDLSYTDSDIPVPVVFDDSLFDNIDLSRLDYYGKRPLPKAVTDGGPRYVSKNPTVIDFKPGADSVLAKRDFSWDNEPDSVSVIPTVKPYKVKMMLDGFFGGFAYAASVGTVGSLQLGLSDIMGNHALGINLAIAGKLKDSNILLSYLYLPHRIDYGVGVFHLYDETEYYYYASPNDVDYLRNRQREAGIYNLVRYPFNKFFRIDFENQLYYWENHWDFSENGIDYEYDVEPAKHDMIDETAVTLVHDNSLYGPTGPLLGWRAYLSLRKSFALHKNDYHTAYMDWRSYTLFSHRYSLALRLVGGFSGGKEPQTYGLNNYYGVRGYTDDNEGEKIALSSVELRFPFLDYMAMAFPLPLAMGSIRGSAFADLGGIWDKNKEFRGMQGEKLKDLHLGFGFGPRMNIGFAVLKLDIAWLTDLSDISKPTYYLSLIEDF